MGANDSSSVLLLNTIQNETISYQNVPSTLNNGGLSNGSSISSNNRHLPLDNELLVQSMYNNLQVITSPSPSAESLTDTTNSSFATPPFSLSPIGESQGVYAWSRVQNYEDVSLPLPPIRLVVLPPPRELEIQRQAPPRNDFGFSLRKAICLDRSSSIVTPVFKPVIFAEPGAMGNATGLLPGDRLMKLNGVSVEDLARETIIEMIRNSGAKVRVQVQPVSELVELSKRCMPNGLANGDAGVGVVGANGHPSTGNGADDDEDVTDRAGTSVSKCNTLRRSASTRFKSQVS